jgi:transcriptional regulator with XRE-family HTH domain
MSDERAANAVDKKVGQRVRSRRLEIGMSQERLAELLGVTFQQVQKYEKGVNRIAVSRLIDIARSLEISACRFFDGLENRGVAEESRDYVNDALATPEGAQLMAVFAGIKSQKVRRKVLDLVKVVAEEDDGKR